MLIEQTLTKMRQLKLFGMADALEEQIQSTENLSLTFEERFSMIIDCHFCWKENQALQNRIKRANFKTNGCIEDIDYHTHRGLQKNQMDQLSLSNWIQHNQNIIITGPTGVGKTYLACAIGHKACRNGFTAQYYYLPKLLRDLNLFTAEGKLSHFLNKLSKINLLIIDDWGSDPLTDAQYRDILEILDDRHEITSTIITSQYPIKTWHDQIGNPTVADAILDRIVHNSYKIELKGESMRKIKSQKKKNVKS